MFLWWRCQYQFIFHRQRRVIVSSNRKRCRFQFHSSFQLWSQCPEKPTKTFEIIFKFVPLGLFHVHRHDLVFQSQRDLLPDDPYQAALVLQAESLVRAENRSQQNLDSSQESVMMMDIPRDDSFVSLVQTMENLPELDLEAHYIDPMTANDPEVQKVRQKRCLKKPFLIRIRCSYFECYRMPLIDWNGSTVLKRSNVGQNNAINRFSLQHLKVRKRTKRKPSITIVFGFRSGNRSTLSD